MADPVPAPTVDLDADERLAHWVPAPTDGTVKRALCGEMVTTRPRRPGDPVCGECHARYLTLRSDELESEYVLTMRTALREVMRQRDDGFAEVSRLAAELSVLRAREAQVREAVAELARYGYDATDKCAAALLAVLDGTTGEGT